VQTKRFLFQLISLVFIATIAAGDEWQTDYEQAISIARISKKNVLLSFMGSDWCGPCIMLHRNALSKPAFMEFAQKNLVLVDIDLPRRKKLEPKIAEQNQRLSSKYDVEQLPTMILLSPEGKVLARAEGYSGQGPEEVVAGIEKAAAKSQ
jgi:thiol-disulfide isomerase/thioredoxin